MFQEKDFTKMRIPPLGDDPDYAKTFRDIPSIMSFNDFSPHKKKIVNYILLMYDPESPFVKRFQNVKSRINEVCDYTGLKRIKAETLKQIVGYRNKAVVGMIDDYVKFINSRLWSMIVVSEATFFEYQTELLSIVTETDSKKKLEALRVKDTLLTAIDKILPRLDGYYSQLYQNDTKLEEIVKTKMITPEGVANGEVYA